MHTGVEWAACVVMTRAIAFLLVVIVGVAVGRGAGAVTNTRPVFCVLTQRTLDESPLWQRLGRSYVVASYVKWLQAGGARPAFLRYNVSDDATFARDLASCDGVLLAGGDMPMNDTTNLYYKRLRRILAEATPSATNKDPVVVWGTCQGFQQLAIITATDAATVWGTFTAEFVGMPLKFRPIAAQSRLFGGAPADVMDAFANHNITQNLHTYGIGADKFVSDSRLANFWDVLSTNIADVAPFGEFVSAMESKRATGTAIFATQFHPERNAFEGDVEQGGLDHSARAVHASAYLSQFIVEAARSRRRSVVHPVRAAMLAERVAPMYTGDKPHDCIDDQTYFFDT